MVDLDFNAVFDHVDDKALIFKLRQLGAGGPFLDILTEFLPNKLELLLMANPMNTDRL